MSFPGRPFALTLEKMLTFAAPWWLLLLLAGPLAAWLGARRRRPALTHALADRCAALPAGAAQRATRIGLLLRFAGLSAAALALAGPRWPDRATRLDTEGIALMLVLDVSGSMAEPTFTWPGGERISRLEAARRTFALLVKGGDAPGGWTFPGRRDDLIGAIAFARYPDLVAPLTLSHDALLELLNAEPPRSLPGEADTNLGDALAWAERRLAAGADGRRQVVVLLSDGEHNTAGGALTPRQAAQLLSQRGVAVYSVDAGGDAAEADPDAAAARQLGRQALQAVARMTDGQAFAAGDGTALLAAGREIDRLERRPLETFRYRRYHDAAPWCALAAACCLALAAGLDATLWRRGPG